MKERDIATTQRIKLGNLLYDKIVKVYAAGRDYWVTRDESKYNDYVIYGSDTPAEKIKLVMATDQHPADKVVLGFKGTNGKLIDTAFGDGNVKQTTVNATDYTLVGNTYVADGQYTITSEGEKAAFDGIVASNAMLTAVNIPVSMNASEYNFSGNHITSIFFHPENTKAKNIDVSDNGIDQQSMNQLMITANGWGTNDGTIIANGGTNATLTGQGIAAKNALIARGWTVITN